MFPVAEGYNITETELRAEYKATVCWFRNLVTFEQFIKLREKYRFSNHRKYSYVQR